MNTPTLFRLGLLMLALALGAPSLAAPPPPPPLGSMNTVIEEIRKLEGERDPKCHATASRLEDLIYGTPLSTEARLAKNDLQKELAAQLWAAASAQAKGQKAKAITAENIAAARRPHFEYEQLPSGDWRLRVGSETVSITKTDKRQYATVAYGLRAILAVEQEHLLGLRTRLLPLSEPAVNALKEALDLLTLAVLQRTDRAAREQSRYEIAREPLQAQWARFLPAAPQVKRGTARPATARSDYPLLKEIIRQKIDSFEKYNQVSMSVFLRNLQVYFARHRWPKEPELGAEFRALYTEAMVAFSQDLLKGAEDLAWKSKQPLIRAADVEHFAQRFIPHRLNEYEDAIFFPRLPKSERIEIEAYDMDAFRDGGLHWRYLQYVIEDPQWRGRLEPDPFAAEVLTENIAQFGVLLLRETGRLAKEDGLETLHPRYLATALKAIQAKIDAHARAKPDAVAAAPIASAGAPLAGGTQFSDATPASGISYSHRMSSWLARLIRSAVSRAAGKPGELTIPPAFQGSGVAAEDIDNDGHIDLLFLGGAGNRLYRNRGDGSFLDLTERAEINWTRPDGTPGEPRQAVFADFDNDGWQDLLITYANDAHRLYHNRGDGRFVDVTANAGLGGEGEVGGPATVLDFDRDGRPDIYLGYFGNYVAGVFPTLARRNSNASSDRLFRNLGGMRFGDVTASAGIDNRGWTQAVTHTDFDGDGWQDVIAGNDFGVNKYYRNLGNGKFADVAAQLGTDKPSYTMGIGLADLNGDELPDVYISNIVLMNKDEKYVLPSDTTPMKFNPDKMARMRVVEANDLFLSRRAASGLPSYEHSDRVGRGYAATGWSWNAEFFDLDNDGDDDLYVVNGTNAYNMYSKDNPYYTDPDGQPRKVEFPTESAETNVLFINAGGLLNLAPGSGADLHGNSRSAAAADFDGDGAIDVALNGFGEPAVILKNRNAKNGNHWAKVRLVGDPRRGVSRDALGAKLLVSGEQGLALWREVRSTGSYLSSLPKEQHFGLGKNARFKLRVIWPDGSQSVFENLAADRPYLLEQANGQLRALAGKD
ncbi:hypothetical protein BURK2_04313 [Burkholderiales bacterium]|nr:hypothetical protein BURK2_04313 [Burkholderiales bacterium]